MIPTSAQNTEPFSFDFLSITLPHPVIRVRHRSHLLFFSMPFLAFLVFLAVLITMTVCIIIQTP